MTNCYLARRIVDEDKLFDDPYIKLSALTTKMPELLQQRFYRILFIQ